MNWNYSLEIFSLVIIIIMIIYSRIDTIALVEKKNIILRICLYVVFFSIVSNLCSIYFIFNSKWIPLFFNYIVNYIYFILTPFMIVTYMWYILAILFEEKYLNKLIHICLIPYLIYVFMVILNPFTKWFFYFDDYRQYTRGYLNKVMYFVCLLYCIITLFIIVYKRKEISVLMRNITIMFCIIGISLVSIQFLKPDIIMSGSAATISLLIIYLYIQNNRIAIDGITKCLNREAFVNLVKFNVKKNNQMNIIAIGLKDFKVVDNRYGKECGDKFIQLISEYLKSIVPNQNIYRYGGCEFVLIIDEDLKINVIDIANVIFEKFNEEWIISEYIREKLIVGISVIDFPNCVKDFDKIINILEYSLNEATEKNKVIFCDENIIDKVDRKLQMMNILKREIEQDGFEVYYQPVYSVRENKFTQAEALVRINDPEMGIILPDEFIPIAEQTGLIVEIGFIVLEKVCKYIKYLDKNDIPISSISVNFSSQQFLEENSLNRVLEIVQRNNISPSKIKLEIREDVFINRFDETKLIMKKFNKNGIQFYLDDFGVGYSNMVYVVNLPFECIKLDRSFIWDAQLSEKTYTLVSTLVAVFAQNEVSVAIGGIESESLKELADILLIDYIQGYYFCTPLKAEEAVDYFIGEL